MDGMKKAIVNSGNATLSVDLEGAQLGSWKIGELEYIWQRNADYWGGSAPILFPIVGGLKGEGKTTIINGKPYHMDLHGFARNMEFSLLKAEGDTILMRLEANEETLKAYPIKFILEIEYKLLENGFSHTFIVKNGGDEDMPFVIGAHPGFNLPLFEGDSFDDYTLEFEKEEKNEAYRIDEEGLVDDGKFDSVLENGRFIPLNHSLFDIGALIYQQMNSHSVKLYNKEGRGIKMDYPDFDYFGIWQMPQKEPPYLCLEPWTGMNDCYSEDGVYTHKRGIQYLKPGEEKRFTFTVTVL